MAATTKKKVPAAKQAKAMAGSATTRAKKTKATPATPTEAPASAPPAAKQAYLLDVPVKFNQVGIGDTTARIGFKVDRGVLKLAKADNLFVNRRLACRVVLGHTDEQPGETRLFEDDVVSIVGSCDVKGYRATGDTFNAALTFSLRDIDVATFARFSKGSGRIRITGAGEIPESEKSMADDDDGDDLFGDDE